MKRKAIEKIEPAKTRKKGHIATVQTLDDIAIINVFNDKVLAVRYCINCKTGEHEYWTEKNGWKKGKLITAIEGNWYEYGRACFTYAERWADLLEKKIEESDDPEKAIVDNAEKLSYEADVEGITGFMYGAAASILSQCWLYGEYLRKWHNKEYYYDGDGVVNPAIITIETE